MLHLIDMESLAEHTAAQLSLCSLPGDTVLLFPRAWPLAAQFQQLLGPDVALEYVADDNSEAGDSAAAPLSLADVAKLLLENSSHLDWFDHD